MSQLTPCPECQRHVRKTEARCPFCDSALSLAGVPAPVLPRNRLGRAATFAFGASVVGATALVACSADEGTQSPVYGAPPAGAGGSFGGSAVYGAPPSGGPNGGTDNDLGGATTIYGGPPAGAGGVDAGGAPAAGGAAGAGGTDDNGEGGGAFAVYGAPAGGDGNL